MVVAIEVHWDHAYGETIQRLEAAGVQLVRAAVVSYLDDQEKITRKLHQSMPEVQVVPSKYGKLNFLKLAEFLRASSRRKIHVVLTGMHYGICHFDAFSDLLIYQLAHPEIQLTFHFVGELIKSQYYNEEARDFPTMTHRFFPTADGYVLFLFEKIRRLGVFVDGEEVGVRKPDYVRIPANNLSSQLYFWSTPEKLAIFMRNSSPLPPQPFNRLDKKAA